MRSGKSLVGKQIISMEDGSRLGTVRDLYLDASLSSVVAVFLGRESIISRKAKFIRRRDINVLGIDAILVSGAKAIANRNRSKDYPKWIRRDYLQGRPVSTPGGTKIANVGDVVIDESGGLIGLALTNMQVSSPIAEKRIVARDTILDIGSESSPMLIDLAKAEEQSKRKN